MQPTSRFRRAALWPSVFLPLAVGLALIAASAAPLYAQFVSRLGEIRVSTYIDGPQWAPSVAMDANGNAVVAWASDTQEAGTSGIYAQRYNSEGLPLGNEFHVNTNTVNEQESPSVAMRGTGEFFVAWNSSSQPGVSAGVYAQRFNAVSVPQGSEFRINGTFTPGRDPSVALASNGNVVVAWSSDTDGNSSGISARRYDAAGVPQGNEFRVNTTTTGQQVRAAVATDATGNFVVAWASFGQDGSGFGIYAQRYNAAGVPQGSEFRVNTGTAGDQFKHSIVMDAVGNFTITWQTSNGAGGIFGIFAQRYNAAGVPQGGEFRIKTLDSFEHSHSIAIDGSGNFTVAWVSVGVEPGFGIQAQRFSPAGVAFGPEFRANTTTFGSQYFDHRARAIAADPSGNFMIVWQGEDGSDWGIYADKFFVATDPVASLTATPNPAAPSQPINFDASGSTHNNPARTIVGYAWDFGDGSPVETGATVAHTFSQFGTYTVELTVTDDAVPPRTANISRNIVVNLGNEPPIADAGGPYFGRPGGTVTLNGSKSTDPNAAAGDRIVLYLWDLDNDGQFDDAFGVSPTVNVDVFGATPNTPATIRLAVIDSLSKSSMATTAFTLDTLPPDTTITDGPAGVVSDSGGEFLFSSSEAGSTFRYSVDGGPETTTTDGFAHFLNLAPGQHTFSVYALDPAGNSDPTPATATWTLEINPKLTVLASRGDPVPGAGLTPGIPEGATWNSFGPPAIASNTDEIIFLAQAKWPASTEAPAGKLISYFKLPLLAGPPIPFGLVRVGGAVPGISGATFAALKDPLIAPDGSVLFAGAIKGDGIDATNKAVVCWSSADGSVLKLVARTGVPIAALDGAKLASIAAMDFAAGGAAVVRGLLVQSGGITTANNAIVLGWDGETGELNALVHEGEALEGLGTLKSFRTLIGGPLAGGSGRGWFGTVESALALRAKGIFSDGTVGYFTVDARTRDVGWLVNTRPPAGGSSPGFRSLGLPSFGLAGGIAFKATTTSRATGMFVHRPAGGSIQPLLSLGDPAPDIPGAIVATVKDPLISGDGQQKGWDGSVKGAGMTAANNRVLFWSNADLPPQLLARKDAQAVEAPEGARWKTFSALGMPGGDRGPLFTAQMIDRIVLADGSTGPGPGGVTPLTDSGLWGVDSLGALRLLLREGDELDSKIVKSFHALKAAAGAPGVNRSFNVRGSVVALVTATDRSTHLVHIRVP